MTSSQEVAEIPETHIPCPDMNSLCTTTQTEIVLTLPLHAEHPG